MLKKYMDWIFKAKVDDKDLTKFSNGLKRLGDDTSKIGASIAGFGLRTSKALTAGIVAGGFAITKYAGDFEEAMNGVQAKTMASSEQMARLSEKAKDLGIRTKYSATEAANAMIELAKAGLSVDEILTGTEAALSLAAAQKMGLSEAATIAADSMAQFKLSAAEIPRINDSIAKAADSATTDVLQMYEALSYAGSVAKSSGMSFEETVSMIAVFAKIGVKGSKAGTALANSLARLKNPTREVERTFDRLGITSDMFMDKSGKLKMTIDNVFKSLIAKGATAADIYEIFGVEAARSLEGVITELGSYNKILGDVRSAQGYTVQQAGIMMKGFRGGAAELRSSFEGLMISLGESGVLGAITDLMREFTGLLRTMAAVDKDTLKAYVKWTLFAAAISWVITILANFVVVGGSVIKIFGSMAAGLALIKKVGFMTWLTGVSKASFLFMGKLLLVAAALYGIYRLIKWISGFDIFKGVTEKVSKFFGGIKDFFSEKFGFDSSDITGSFKKDLSATVNNLGGVDRSSLEKTISNSQTSNNQNVNITAPFTFNGMGANADPEKVYESYSEKLTRTLTSATSARRPVYAQ